MKANPILQEVWDIKDRLAAEAGYDIHRFVAQLREWEASHQHLLVTGKEEEPTPDTPLLREEPKSSDWEDGEC